MKLIKFNSDIYHKNADVTLTICRILILLFSASMLMPSYAENENKCGENGIKCSANESDHLKSETKHQKLRSIKNPEDINDDDPGLLKCTTNACNSKGYKWEYIDGEKYCRPC